MPELSVFVTSEDNKRLAKLIESMQHDAGWGEGLDVKKDEKVEGKYVLVRHNGEQDIENMSVRLYQGKILTGKGSERVEGMLRQNKVKFERYDGVNIENPNAKNPEINLRKPQLAYNP